MSDRDYVASYLKTITTPSANTKKLFAIGFVGLNGSGKSTIAKMLAERLNLYVASNDRIRRWLNEQGFPGDSPAQELMQQIAEASSRYLYEHNISHVIDNDLMRFHPTARANATAYGADLLLIHVFAPEAIILKRLEQREQNDEQLSRVGADEYFKRKTMHAEHTMPEVIASIDTSKDVGDQIDKVVRTLQSQGYV